jgi:hypothetical protein
MQRGPLADRITTAFETMPGSCKRLLATFSPPQDVALLSMHEQTGRAGGQPSSMNHLAQRFGAAQLRGSLQVRDLLHHSR